jgi:small subunit ribosomal protein S9
VVVANPYVWGTGRRKTSIARVRVKPGTGQFLVNGEPMDRFFTTADTRRSASKPLVVTETTKNYDVFVQVEGGGITGQADSTSLGLARALKTDNPGLEPVLRQHGLLTRDSREVERKKYGLRGARRATQFSKR